MNLNQRAAADRNGAIHDADGTICELIRRELFALQDPEYRDFQEKLIPGLESGSMIGVRTPALRTLARRLARECSAEELEEFLADLPHRHFDENQLHAFLISEEKNYDLCMQKTEAFLPFIDNWATCDQLSPKAFKKHRTDLPLHIRTWICDEHTYTVRFAIGTLMRHFLDEDFDPAWLELVASVRSEEYYVNMMIAWYFATALAKQYDAALPYLLSQRLEPWTHNKTIQKAVESYRISPKQKTYLKTLKIKQKR